MEKIEGKSVYSGVAIGPLYYYSSGIGEVTPHTISDVDKEIKTFEDAREKAIEQLKTLQEKASKEVGDKNAAIFEIHQMMLQDLDYCEAITNTIKEKKEDAAYAVYSTGETFAMMFSAMDDVYMQARAADVKDISSRIIGILSGHDSIGFNPAEPVVIIAEDLAPSETIQMDKTKILGFVTEKGSTTSHTAILARTMGIPALVNTGVAMQEYDGKTCVLDATVDTLYIEPDKDTLTKAQAKQTEIKYRDAQLELLRGKDNVTLDGQKIDIYANIGSLDDLQLALDNDAGGIGLFRTEFIYLNSNNYPTEEEQFEIYKTVAEKMNGKRVVFRTLDIGADKQVDYFDLPHEENPAMGFRAIRICLARPEIFKTQLRALYRASAFGKVSIMFPMITSISEIVEIKRIAQEVRQDLNNEGITFNKDVELGIMIETPAAAVISDKLAKEVDFFSVGTNDLTQYTLAIDRQNQKLEGFYNPYHTAISRLIKFATDNAHKEGIWIGICGELGADPHMTETFLAIGVDELSVSPSSVLPLRAKIRQLDMEHSRQNILDTIALV